MYAEKGCLKEGSKFSFEYTLKTKVLLKKQKENSRQNLLAKLLQKQTVRKRMPPLPSEPQSSRKCPTWSRWISNFCGFILMLAAPQGSEVLLHPFPSRSSPGWHRNVWVHRGNVCSQEFPTSASSQSATSSSYYEAFLQVRKISVFSKICALIASAENFRTKTTLQVQKSSNSCSSWCWISPWCNSEQQQWLKTALSAELTHSPPSTPNTLSVINYLFVIDDTIKYPGNVFIFPETFDQANGTCLCEKCTCTNNA